LTELAGRLAGTASTLGPTPSIATHAKALNGSYGSLWMTGLVVKEVEMTSSVYPSGCAFATVSVPMIELPPARLSTTTDLPRRSDSGVATMRPTMSLLPAGGNGTISRIGRAGYESAALAAPVSSAHAASIHP
jgi:hypothetical protein